MPSFSGKTLSHFFPSLLVLAILSNIIYYLNVFNGNYAECTFLVVIAITSLILGYFIGFSTVANKYKRSFTLSEFPTLFNSSRLRTVAFLFFVIGIGAHVLYYASHPLTSYADSYGASKGAGYITAFFIFWPLSILLNEFLISRKLAGRGLRIINIISIVLFCFAYFFLLMKRRQIIFLLVSICAIWGPKIKISKKLFAYIVGGVLVLGFMIFGKIRGYYDVNGLESSIAYAIANFTPEWFSLEDMEGKFISRTLADTFNYVQTFGCDPSVLIGVATCLVPRVLLGGVKPLAFPEWYTSHFYPDNFAAGTGYAGSMVAEFYLIGGVAVIIIGYALFGFLCARLQARGSRANDPVGNMLYFLFIYLVLLFPRYDLASLLIDFVFTYIPIIWAMRISIRHNPYTNKQKMPSIEGNSKIFNTADEMQSNL